MSAEPRFFYFDMGNVLLHFSHETACRQMAEVAGVSTDQVRQVVFDDELQWRYERGEVTSRQFYEEFCAAVGVRPDFDQLLTAGSDIFQLNTPMVPLVAQLRASGRRIGILSNTCDAHWRFVTDGRFTLLRDYFEVHALSHEIGAMKPDPKAYEAAARLADVSPPEIFFCDDREENVAAARAAQFDAVLYTSPAELAAELRRRGVRFNY